MTTRSLPSMLALCVLASVPAASRDAPASREVVDSHVSTLFANCVRAVLAPDDAIHVSLKKVFPPISSKDPNQLQARDMPGVTLRIHGKDGNAGMLIAQNNAQDNRAIAELMREKLKVANARQESPSKVAGGESWLVTVPAGDDEAARVTLELAWDDTFLVIHFLDPSAPAPVPVPPIPPPPAPPPRR